MAFKSLVSVVSEQCQEIKQAVASLSYFETWDGKVVGECCRVSSVAEYPPDQIILGPEIGSSHTVYFVLEGVCKMVKNLRVEVKTNSLRKKTYKLYRNSELKTSNLKATNEGYSSRLFNQIFQKEEITKTPSDLEGAETHDEMKSRSPEPQNSSLEVVSDNFATEVSTQTQSQEEVLEDEAEKSEAHENPNLDFRAEEHLNNPVGEIPEQTESEKEIDFLPDHHIKVLEECVKRRKKLICICKNEPVPEKPKSVESFFVQIGFLSKGACFGLEKSENFIMSLTKVKCLKIPQRFLYKQKPSYIWDRIRLFHSRNLPKDEDILRYLRSDRNWMRKKKKLSEEIAFSKSIPNYTLISEVPYSVRLSDVR